MKTKHKINHMLTNRNFLHNSDKLNSNPFYDFISFVL